MRKKSSGDKLHNNFTCQSGFLSEYTKTMTLKMKSLMNITKIVLVKLRKNLISKESTKIFLPGMTTWKSYFFEFSLLTIVVTGMNYNLPNWCSNQNKIIYNPLSWIARNSFSIKEWVKILLKKKQIMCRSEKKRGVCRTK